MWETTTTHGTATMSGPRCASRALDGVGQRSATADSASGSDSCARTRFSSPSVLQLLTSPSPSSLATLATATASAAEGGGGAGSLELSRPIVYGNVATYFGFTRSDGHTHKWTLYVRPYRDEHDLGQYIKKVVFVLEPHYPNEEVFQPPFEVTRTGWGEFAVSIKLVFRQRTMRALSLHHLLRLVEYEEPEQTPVYTAEIMSEHYDEIVISRPPPKIRTLFRSDTSTDHSRAPKSRSPYLSRPSPNGSTASGQRNDSALREFLASGHHGTPARERADEDRHARDRAIQLKNILRGQQIVEAEISRIKDRLVKNYHDIEMLHRLIEATSHTPVLLANTSAARRE